MIMSSIVFIMYAVLYTISKHKHKKIILCLLVISLLQLVSACLAMFGIFESEILDFITDTIFIVVAVTYFYQVFREWRKSTN